LCRSTGATASPAADTLVVATFTLDTTAPPKRELALGLLLAAALARLWLMPLPSSLWTDEMGTAFILHYGPGHPSLSVVHPLVESIYYLLPRAAEALGGGFSEIVDRCPPCSRWPSRCL
jgi:hypothetical protein